MSQKYSEMPLAAPFDGTELFCVSQDVTSKQSTLAGLFSNINFEFESGVLDTIQDITISSSPTFQNLNLDAITNNSTFTFKYPIAPGIAPYCVGLTTASAFDDTNTLREATLIDHQVTDSSQANFSGGLNFIISESGFIQSYLVLDGEKQNVQVKKRMEALQGYQSYAEQIIVSTNQNVDNTIVGKCAINNTISDVVLTLTENDNNNINSEFQMLRNEIGNFTISAAPNVFLNGVVNGSYQMPEQYDRIIIRKITQNEYVYTVFSGSGSVGQDSEFGEMFFQGNTAQTVISAVNTPVAVTANYQVGNLSSNFTFLNGELTYIGTADINVLISANLTASLNFSTATITPSIALNGVEVDKSKQSPSLVGVSPAYESLSVSCILSLSTGDSLSLLVENNTNTDNIIIKDLNTFNVQALGVVDVSGGSGLSGDFQLGSCLVPTTSYGSTLLDWTSVISQLNGTQTIAPNSLNIGESVQMSCQFGLFPANPDNQTAVSGRFRLVIGSTIIDPLANIILTNNASRSGWFDFRITRTSQNEISFSFNGIFTKTDVSPQTLIGSPALWATQTLPYNETQNYLVDVEWSYVGGPLPDYYLDCVVDNLIINQFTSRRSAGSGSQVVESWDGSTLPVNVTAGNNIDIANGVISNTYTSNFFSTLFPNDNYAPGVYTPVWFTSTGNNQIDANTWEIGDTFEIDIVGEFVTRQQVADTTTGSFFRLTVGSNQILSNDLDVQLINDGTVRVKPFNFKIMFTRIDDVASLPTWTISGNGFFSDLANTCTPISLQTSTLYNIDVTVNNIINLEYQQNHSVGNTYDFQCVQLNMRKHTV